MAHSTRSLVFERQSHQSDDPYRHHQRTWRRIGHCLIYIVIVLGGGPSVAAQSSDDPRSADVAAIRASIETIFQAFVDKDLKRLESTHGISWRGFTPWSGHVIRGLDGYMREATFPQSLSKGQGMVSYRLSDFDVTFYADTAVVSFVADIQSVLAIAQIHQKLTILDVYHREPAGWIQVASNTSLHPEEIEREKSRSRVLNDDERKAVFLVRDAVWRAWFAGDADALSTLVPHELVTLEPNTTAFGTRDSVVAASRAFAASGARLTRLAFPRTELQSYGNTVVLYTTYELDLVTRGQIRTERGRATEIFVQQNGSWANTGWQLSPAGK
jgi:ketosteroid isomerase-like protein